jgi:dihydrofolate synthase/folylpolyglutamate synthase
MRAPVRFASLSAWLEWQERLHPRAIEPGLERLERVLSRLGWQPPPVPVITVGGTNGKGSCVAFLEAILGASGRRVATFTSPHLIDYRERIRVAGRDVTATTLIVAFERIADALGGDTLTFFEFNALAALLVFATASPDCILLEVGMGGRLDAVNVVDADVAIVASLGLDHVDWLGPDLASIAREKAGIMRHDRPAVFGGGAGSEEIGSAARAIGARLLRRGHEFDASQAGNDRWRYADERWHFDDLPLPALSGAHQVDNAATTLAALSSLQSRLPVRREHIDRGLREAFVPGRFQRVQALGRKWILDVAHNTDGAIVLARSLAATRGTGRTLAVCGMLADKDVKAVLEELHPVVDRWYATSTGGDRGLASAELARCGLELGLGIEDAGPLADGLSAARDAAQPDDRIVVFGSFHTVGPALAWLRARTSAPDRWLRSETSGRKTYT